MRRLPFVFAALLSLPVLPAWGADSYADAVRCHDAAAVYAQQYVVAGVEAPAMALMGYSRELKARAIKLGAAQGKAPAAVEAAFRDNNVVYVKTFFSIANGAMTPTAYGNGEIAYCHLDKVIAQ